MKLAKINDSLLFDALQDVLKFFGRGVGRKVSERLIRLTEWKRQQAIYNCYRSSSWMSQNA